MANSIFTKLSTPEVHAVLERLHALAQTNDNIVIQQFLDSGADWQSVNPQQKAMILSDALLPISKDNGRFLYSVARSISAKHIVEFGTSFGISTIYLAAALHDNGGGLVIGSELDSSKVAKATQNVVDAGLSEFVEIRGGDALQTLGNLHETIDLLFLDGWKDLYLDVLHLTLGNLRTGAVILADDINMTLENIKPYLDYVRNRDNGFISVALPIDDGIEYSVKL